MNPGARSAFIGMSMDTSREDMNQAVLEGVAFGLRDSLEIVRSLGIEVSRSKICGGGARSGIWKKILANILNVTLEVPEADEGPALGGAVLAAVGCGVFPNVEAAADQIVRVRQAHQPEKELVGKYEEQIPQICKALSGPEKYFLREKPQRLRRTEKEPGMTRSHIPGSFLPAAQRIFTQA